MSIELSRHVETILCEAVEISNPDERAAYLDRVCGSDEALRRETERLIANHFRAGAFLERPGAAPPATLPLPACERPGSQIGRYKLLEQIGEGGMGIVYMAEQTEPVRRRVALKIIKPGMDSRQVVGRFESERQALAMMDHPHIARVLDAGQTDGGRPFFVMELVRGLPITEYCDKARLTPRQRLELMITVCQAIHHAHQKGIIHRDLKPSNVLVTLHDGKPVAKVIDFGIAKATGQQLTDKTLFTSFAQMVGTPLYMSPEQAELSGLDVDTRSDVYSLGVLLYELLTGHTPFDKEMLAKAGLDEVRRIIREEEPARPSHRFSTLDAQTMSTLSEKRGIDERQLRKVLRGELDWIVMKALEKDRSRRYESASAMGTDLQRYLGDEPVQACPPSIIYRLRKFLHRRRQQVTLAAVVIVAAVLLMSTAVGVWYSRWQVNAARATRVRESLFAARGSIDAGSLEQAEHRIAQAQAVLGEGVPLRDLASNVQELAAEVVSRRADQQDLEKFLKLTAESQDKMGHSQVLNGDQLATQALELFGVLKNDKWLTDLQRRHFTSAQQKQIKETAYVTLVSLADYGVRWKTDAARSQELLSRAAAFHQPTKAFHFVQGRVYRILGNHAAADAEEAIFKAAPAVTAWDHYLPGHTAGWNGDLPEAIRSYEAALRIQPDHFNSLFFLAERLRTKKIDRIPEALRLFTGCIALRPDDGFSFHNRGECYQALGDNQNAEADFTRAIELASRDLDRIGFTERRRDFYDQTGQRDKLQREVEQLVRLRERYLEQRQSEFGPNARETLISTVNLATAYRLSGQLEKALPLFEKSHAASLRQFGDKDPDTLTSLHNLALGYDEQGRLDRAVPLYEQALQGRKAVLAPDHEFTLGTMHLLADAYYRSGQHEKALPLASEVAAKRRDKLGLDNLLTLQSLDLWSSIQFATGQKEEALKRWEECYSAMGAKSMKTHPMALLIALHLGNAYSDSGKPESGTKLLAETLGAHQNVYGRDNRETLNVMNDLAQAYEKLGRILEAEQLAVEVLAKRKEKLGPMHADTINAMGNLGALYLTAKQPEKALPILREFLELHRKAVGDESTFADWQAGVAVHMLSAGLHAEVEPILRECLATRMKHRPDDWRTFNTQSMLGGALAGLKRFDEAESLLLAGYQGMKDRQKHIPPDGKIRLPQAAERLAQLYEGMGVAEKAEHWRGIAASETPAKP